MATRIASLLLRFGLAFGFGYAAISGFVSPDLWIGFLPQWLGAIAPREILLRLFGVYEVLLAAALLCGIRKLETAILASLTLLAITVANLSVFVVTFRDVSLALAAAALAALEYGKRENP
jgi:hypothetical protein